MFETGTKVNDTAIAVFELEAYECTSAPSITDVDGMDATPSVSAEFITDQSVDKFYQILAIRLCQAKIELTFNKKKVLMRRAPVDGAL